jgi:hypothetical protein
MRSVMYAANASWDDAMGEIICRVRRGNNPHAYVHEYYRFVGLRLCVKNNFET